MLACRPVATVSPKGNHLGVCACPPGAQENYTSNESPARELPDGTKNFCAPGVERGFFHKSSSLVKYVAVLSIFSTQWPINGPATPRSRTRVPAACMLNKTSRNLAQNTPGLGFGMCQHARQKACTRPVPGYRQLKEQL